MIGTYVLIGQTPVPEPDLLTWAHWFEDVGGRTVYKRRVGPFTVSTMFLGIDHAFLGGPPILFETMIFSGCVWMDYQTRCSTWLEAELMHAQGIAHVRTLWRRPRELTSLIVSAVPVWMTSWGWAFYGRYGKTPLDESLAVMKARMVEETL